MGEENVGGDNPALAHMSRHTVDTTLKLTLSTLFFTCPLLHLSPVMLEHVWVFTPTTWSTALRESGEMMAPWPEAEATHRARLRERSIWTGSVSKLLRLTV